MNGKQWNHEQALDREARNLYPSSEIPWWEEAAYAHGPEVDEWHIAGQPPAWLLEMTEEAA